MTDRPIVVPLDGSELSEAAVPYACAVAKAASGRVLLVTVWDGGEELFGGELRGLADDILKFGEEYFAQYLKEVAQRIDEEGLETEAQVLLGTPADEILRLLRESEARMLVMSTHGRSGLGRWWYGSVASRLVREAPVPTMVVGPKLLGETGRVVKQIRRVLVPLNGSALAETALSAAAELADALGADLLLAEVLTWATQAFVFGVPDVDVAQIDKELTAAAERYLAEQRDRLRTERAVEISVLHGRPADTLIELIEAQDIDLVVMASHTRSGFARVALGSVADRLLQGAAPVLIVRPEVTPAAGEAGRGRYCHACGRASPYVQVLPEDRCPRCGQHLHACGNCVYFDGVGCLIQRPEIHDPYPGRDCPQFQFRETALTGASGSKGGGTEGGGRVPFQLDSEESAVSSHPESF